MEKYGFIYLWYDAKHKKYYVGRHWGHEDDGYICSSNNMRHNYRNRPVDFRRRIISKVYTCQEDLVLEEQRWLDMIKPEECKIRYYNISLNAKAPSMRGKKHSKETIEKIRSGNKNRVFSEEQKNKLSESRKKHSGPNKGKKFSEEHKRKLSERKKDYFSIQDNRKMFSKKWRETWKNNRLENQ